MTLPKGATNIVPAAELNYTRRQNIHGRRRHLKPGREKATPYCDTSILTTVIFVSPNLFQKKENKETREKPPRPLGADTERVKRQQKNARRVYNEKLREIANQVEAYIKQQITGNAHGRGGSSAASASRQIFLHQKSSAGHTKTPSPSSPAAPPRGSINLGSPVQRLAGNLASLRVSVRREGGATIEETIRVQCHRQSLSSARQAPKQRIDLPFFLCLKGEKKISLHGLELCSLEVSRNLANVVGP